MKVLVVSVLLLLLGNGNAMFQQKNLMSLADAEKILGEPAKLTGNTTNTESGVVKERRVYTALADAVNDKTRTLFFNFEQYPSERSARQLYRDIFTSNQRNAGIKAITGLGDEAFLHSDTQNFHLMMARKSNKIVRLKVNKITSHTSVAQMQKVMGLIIAGL